MAPKGAEQEEVSTPNPIKSKKKKKKAKELPDKVATEAAAADTAAVAAAAPKKKKKKRARELEECVEEAAAEEPPVKKKKKDKRSKQAAVETDGDRDVEAASEEKQLETTASSSGVRAVDCTVFVDGVPYTWTASKVEQHFEHCGTIAEVRAPTWQDSGRLRGFAHVTFTDKAGAKKALAMDGSKVDKKGRYLKIEIAKAAATTGPTVDLEGKRRLFVKNLPYDATEDEIGKFFSTCGKVREVRIPTSFGRSKGFAYVEFARSESLKAAFDMKPELRGRALRLDADSGSGPKAGFHYRPEAFESTFAPSKKGGKGSQKGGKGSNKGKSGKGKKLSLFDD